MHPSEALVILDASVTAVTLGRGVSFHPDMLHSLEEYKSSAFVIQAFNAFSFCVDFYTFKCISIFYLTHYENTALLIYLLQ